MTPNEIVAICTAREGCAGCPFARRPSTCDECGAEIEDDEDAPACAAEVDGLEPYLWPMTPPDLFSAPPWVTRHAAAIQAIRAVPACSPEINFEEYARFVLDATLVGIRHYNVPHHHTVGAADMAIFPFARFLGMYDAFKPSWDAQAT